MEPTIRSSETRLAKKTEKTEDCTKGDWSRGYTRCSLFGAALVGTEIYDSNICPHGPQGCMHVVREATAQQNRETDFAQSGMTQKDVIFGGRETLVAAFLETMAEYEQAGPKISISTCAPEIIGDNMTEVISLINPKLPVVEVSGGYQGDQYRGVNETLLQLVKKFADPEARLQPGLVNLIGNIGGSRQWRADVREMIRLLSALGLSVNRLVCDSKLDDVRRASHAEATILTTPEIGRPAAEYLHRTFHRPVVTSPLGLPLGLRGTEVWLRTIGEKLRLDSDKLEALLNREEEEVRMKLKVGLNNMVFIEKTDRIKRMPVALVAEGICALSWARFLAGELEMRPSVVASRTRVSTQDLHPDLTTWLDASNNHAVLVEPSLEAVRQAIERAQPELVLGSSLEAEMVREIGLPTFLHIAHPNHQYVDIVERPYLGYRGMLNVCQQILNRI